MHPYSEPVAFFARRLAPKREYPTFQHGPGALEAAPAGSAPQQDRRRGVPGCSLASSPCSEAPPRPLFLARARAREWRRVGVPAALRDPEFWPAFGCWLFPADFRGARPRSLVWIGMFPAFEGACLPG